MRERLDQCEPPSAGVQVLRCHRYGEALARAICAVIGQYEDKQTPEALCARDADKLECLLQGIEYRAQGYANAQRWIDNSRARLVTKSGNTLAEALLSTDSLDWLRSALGENKRGS